MKAKILKSEEEYELALGSVETLMDARPNSQEEEELELLAFLIESYEKEHYPIGLPDPVEAIKFRMEQEGLTRKDMRKYLGSQSKVSEVLNRKRSLSLTMIRNLYEGLGIPAEVLLQSPGEEIQKKKYDYREYPFTEMFKRGYFSGHSYTLNEAKEYSEELIMSFFSVFAGKFPKQIYCRKTDRDIEEKALLAWHAKVLWISQQEELPEYDDEDLNKNLIRELVNLSYYSKGPQLAKELLNRKGIHLIVLPHLPKTYLDGACFYSSSRHPVIGLTIRHDRLDNFWFTLVHELAHLHLHLPDDSQAFFDNTDPIRMGDPDPQEREADRLAFDCLIPSTYWNKAKTKLLNTSQAEDLRKSAEELRISTAIVAGRVRWESGDYSKFPKLVGSKKVRSLFSEFD